MFEGNAQESVDFLIWQCRLEWDHRQRDIFEGDHRLTTDGLYRATGFPDSLDKILQRYVYTLLLVGWFFD